MPRCIRVLTCLQCGCPLHKRRMGHHGHHGRQSGCVRVVESETGAALISSHWPLTEGCGCPQMTLARGMRASNSVRHQALPGPTPTARPTRGSTSCPDRYEVHMVAVGHWVALARSADSHGSEAHRSYQHLESESSIDMTVRVLWRPPVIASLTQVWVAVCDQPGEATSDTVDSRGDR